MPIYAPFEETPYGRLRIVDHYLGHCSEELSKHLPFRPGLTVLDYACGGGGILDYLLPRTGQAWGMMPASPPVEYAYLAARMAVAQGVRLPLADACLDAISLHDIHPGEIKAVLAEAARTLRPGGHLLWLLERRAKIDACAALALPGFTVHEIEPLNYLTYPAMVLLSRLGSLGNSALGQSIMKLVTVVDGLLAQSKAFQSYSRHLIVVAEKR